MEENRTKFAISPLMGSDPMPEMYSDGKIIESSPMYPSPGSTEAAANVLPQVSAAPVAGAPVTYAPPMYQNQPPAYPYVNAPYLMAQAPPMYPEPTMQHYTRYVPSVGQNTGPRSFDNQTVRISSESDMSKWRNSSEQNVDPS